MIVAVRHPRPSIDAGICYGRLDVALASPAGQDAEALAKRLASRRFDEIVSSPLQRALRLACAAGTLLGLPVRLEPRLQEIDFGSWEGVAWSAIAPHEIDAWAADPLGYSVGGGESVNELLCRVTEVWNESVGAPPQIWITHSGPMRCLAALSQGIDVMALLQKSFAYGELLELRS